MTEHVPSSYQKAIYQWVGSGMGNAVVEAVAGSGKTSTIVKALDYMRGDVLFAAFNKHIADELKLRVPKYVDARTIHSLGFMTLVRRLGCKVDGKKVQKLVQKVTNRVDMATLDMRTDIANVASLAKMTLCDYTSPEALLELIEYYDLDIPETRLETIIEKVPEVLKLDLEDTKEIDFDDMVWMPLKFDLKVRGYDWVCVDEAQDLSGAQQALAMKALRPGGRFVAIGDSRQSIYGFRGADPSSMPTIRERLKAIQLPLSISYRCPRSHIALAQAIVPRIEAAPNAKEGVVYEMKLDAAAPRIQDDDLVLCRTNAPLAKIALRLIRDGKKAKIRGRDISGNLLRLVNRIDAATLSSFLSQLDEYRDREAASLRSRDKDSKAISLEDKVDTIEALAEGLRTVEELKERINDVFSDETKGIVCSTVHRAKGLEANRVFIYRPDLLPFPYAKKESLWQHDQEMNLKYVALTRSKSELTFIERDQDFEKRR